ncbi:EAL domain-containing protein [Clostridium sp. LIBA-8841]|uniref:sensor domain-containing protein n=1 Tax=Clostridium sp. LIBA-8841 TaxID=2987530 RepID=UPI002AC53F8B|nr:EAL domain-containing protein [Clostridium sp. LIBA-8841]MDZ5255102.1 EAL domain-containing protein [Clostridium sp. LIBA-8841]
MSNLYKLKIKAYLDDNIYNELLDLVDKVNYKHLQIERVKELVDLDFDVLILQCNDYDILKNLRKKDKIFLITTLNKSVIEELGIEYYAFEYSDSFSRDLLIIDFIEYKAKEKVLKYVYKKDIDFNSIMNEFPFQFFLKDLDGTVLKSNNKALNDEHIEFKIIMNVDNNDLLNEKELKRVTEEDKLVIQRRTILTFNNVYYYNGQRYIFEVYKIPLKNKNGIVELLLCIYMNITEKIKKLEEIKRLTEIDPLTKLKNRRFLTSYLNQLREDGIEEIGIFLMDIDNFKLINDSVGHTRGNQLLIEFSNNLKKCFKNQFIARIAGDEFIIVFNDLIDKEKLAEKIDDFKIELKKYERDSEEIISVSTGILIDNLQENSLDMLLKKVDLTLVEAKRKNRSSYIFYSEELNKKFNLILNVKRDILKAIEEKEIVLFYQPQYTIDKKLTGFEALTRWNTPKYDKIPTDKIIEIIEHSEYLNKFNNYIMKEAFLFAKKINRNRKNKLVVSINISALQIIENDFIDDLERLLEETKVCNKYICIEITETAFFKNTKQNLEKINYINNVLGIAINLDDFGTGFSSLSYLIHMPINAIKIDKAFITDIHKNNKKQVVVKIIKDIGTKLGMQTMAEGVECKEELDILKDIQIDKIQGYYFSKPLSEEETLKLIDR